MEATKPPSNPTEEPNDTANQPFCANPETGKEIGI
jgi:hypothetical protein